MATSTILDPNTTIIAVDVTNFSKTVVLPYNPPYTKWNPYSPTIPQQSRIVYFKNSPLSNTVTGTLNLYCSSGVSIIKNFLTTLEKPIDTRDCFTLLELSFITIFGNPNDYFLPLSVFDSSSASYSYVANPTVGAVTVSASGNNSFLFVDLQTQSKAIILPPIPSISATSSNSAYFTIKDVNGNANTNNLFISTSGGALIDGYANSTIQITQNFACIELAANQAQSNWLVLNYFNGTL